MSKNNTRSQKSNPKGSTNGWAQNKKSKIVSLRNIADHSTQQRTAVGNDEPLFQSFPSEVTFSDFKPFSVHTATISLRNKDVVARRVQLEPPGSHFFTLSAPQRSKNNSSKVAPGMEVQYKLTFKPEATCDYNCDLICTTEREQFVIPVRARGDRPSLAFPDKIEFPKAPVNSVSTHPFLLRNYGPRATSFSLTVPQHYSVAPANGFIEVGDAVHVKLDFNPPKEGPYKGNLLIDLDDDVRMSALLSANVESVDVCLESEELECPSTYIQKLSQQTVRLFNRSDIPIEFNWRNAQGREEEGAQRRELLIQLALNEEHDRANLDAFVVDDSQDEDGMSEPSDEEDRDEYRRQRAEQAIVRKYRKLRQELDETNFSFTHENFSIEPISGEIWPNGEKTITVTFKPKAVKQYPVTAFCDVTGSSFRLPLNLNGLGVGPKAVFSYETLDIGDVYINAVHRYTVGIENVGEIEAEYRLLPPNGTSRFNFTPNKGVLKEGKEVEISITFTSNTIGEFVEVLKWSLQGTIEPLKLTFKGNVIGPTFFFDEEALDYGLVSYGFLNSQPLTLHNTSEIPMKYFLRIPEDGKFMDREFGITPNTGNIMPGEKAPIKIDFVSETVKRYEDYSVVIDVDGVGQALMNIPITAECQVSDVIINMDTLDYGEIFLRHPVTKSIPMQNLSDNLHAKFEVQPQDEASKEIATITPERPTAAIAPASEYALDVALTAHRLGLVKLPVFLKVPGSGTPPKCVTVTSTAVGPKVKLDKELMDWGKTFVLRDVPQKLIMTNDSPIPAEFKAFVHKKASCFSVDPPQGRMKPYESIEVTVNAKLNEIQKITDTLHILIHEGADLSVKLSARGVGTTIHATTNIERIDHGNQFTNNVTTSTFRLENRGRRPQTLVWNYVPPGEENDPKAASRRRKNKKDDVELPNSIFSITPRKVVLEPMMAMEYTVQGITNKAGEVGEQWICGSLMGSDAKEFVDIYTCRVAATFVDPLIKFSRSEVSFQQMNDPKNPMKPQAENISIKNIATLPLFFWMKVPHPFSSERLEFELQPGESAETAIHFSADIQGDKESAKIKSNLIVQYRDHPQKDKLPLFGEICFPNLTFESTKIDFGCILNETSKRLTKKITNNSKIEVKYEWVFYENDDSESQDVSINEIFDILPIRGILPPGASEEVEFVFYGNIDTKVQGMAVCEVVGGPEYEIELMGESSNVAYRLDKSDLDFGPKDMGSVEERDITLYNTGRVGFEFSIDLKTLTSSVVSVNPKGGRLNAGEKQKLTIKLDTCLPSRIKETFQLIVAYFDPVPICVNALGVYPSAIFSLPRADTPDWQRLVDQAGASLAEKATEDDEEMLPLPTASASMAQTLVPKVVYQTPLLSAALKTQNPLVETHLEADRMNYMEHALKEMKAPQKVVKKAKAQKKKEAAIFVISSYECDFGNVILGQSKKMSFKVTNTGLAPISFDLNKRSLAGTVFSIEPMQVLRLPPGQTVEFQAQCVTNARKHKQEQVDVQLPVLVRGGPEIKLSMKSNITVPDIELSTTKLDFGPVYVGQRKEIPVQIFNNKEVPCEWSLKSIIASSNGKDRDSWDCIPGEGVLAPGARQNIIVAFQPLEKKKMTAKVPLRVTMNPRGLTMNCKGTGLTVGLDFAPPVLNLGPVLPYQKSDPFEVTLQNTGNKAIEVYSLDFDEQYHDEENILRGDESYVDGVMYVPPRKPGETLPTFILKAHRNREKRREVEAALRAEREAKAAAEAAARAAAAAEAGEPLPEPEPEAKEPETEQEVGELADAMDTDETEESCEISNYNVLVIGGPLSGRTTVAKALAEEHDISQNIISSFDHVVQWHLDVNTKVEQIAFQESEDQRIRESGSKKEKDALAAREAENVEVPSFDDETLETASAIKDALGCFRASQAPEEAERSVSQKSSKRAGKKPPPKKKGGKDESDAVESVFSGCKSQPVFEEALLVKALKLYLLQPQFNKGVVFDSLDNSILSIDALAICIKKVFEELGAVRDNNMHVVALRIDRETAIKRVESLKETCQALLDDKESTVAMKKFKVLGDKELAKLAGEKLTKYAELLQLFNKRQKAQETLEKIDKHAGKIANFYGVEAPQEAMEDDPEEKKEEGDVATSRPASAATGVQAPYMHTHIVLQMFGMSHPFVERIDESQITDGCLSIKVNEDLKWIKVREFLTSSKEEIHERLVAYLAEEFYVEDDPSLLDPSWVPPPKVHQLIHFPEIRCKRPPATNFFFVDRKEEMPQPKAAVEKEPETGKGRKLTSSKGKKSAKKEEPPVEKVPAEPLEPIITYVPSKQTRWVIPAKGSTTVLVQFLSDKTGRYNHNLGFEIVGTRDEYILDARGTCAVPEIAQEPRSVFMRRVKHLKHNMIVHRQYITQDKIFDFGPLILGKDPASRLLPPSDEDRKAAKGGKGKKKKCLSAVRKTNGETFRITNTGLFDLQVDFSFRDAVNSIVEKSEDAEEEKGKKPKTGKKKDAKKAKKHKGKDDLKEEGGPQNDPTQPIFIVDPPVLTIPKEEMMEVTVWAFPQDVSVFNDVLICSVKDNPMAIQFPVRCEGAKPTVELSASELEFDRLLLGQSESKNIEIRNVSNVPVVWNLTGLEELGEELRITPQTSGVIQPLDTGIVTVTFKGIEQQEYNYTIPLEIRDAEGILGLVDTKPITIQAEAFKMDAAVEIPESGLDFSVIRVNDAEQREFKIVNQGKYDIKYGFSTAPKSQNLFSQILTIEPEQGTLTPGQEQVIVVTAKTTAEDVVKCSDLKLHLIEGGTEEVVRSVPIAINLRSVFSQFRILPVHGVNFGPLELGVTKTKKMQICNDGEFDFLFRVFPSSKREKYPNPLGAPDIGDGQKSGKKDKKKKDKKSARSGKGKGDGEGDSFQLGPFSVSPVEGSIPPGSTLDIIVTMEATEMDSYLEQLEVDISQREYTAPGGHMAEANRFRLDLTGESCSPGVDTTGWESIFEEQPIMSKISGRVVDKNCFALEEKAFVFAPVIANQRAGAVRSERFRISNPFKVPCNVQFRVFMQDAEVDGKQSSRGKKPSKKGGKKDDAGPATALCPFKIDPPAAHIPNHEHRYVTVSFNPTALQAYTAILEATVDKGSDPQTRQLKFELRGEGTLPHVTVSQPTARTEEGQSLMQFDRVFCHPQLNRSQTLPMVLYNPGIVPATCRFDMDSSDAYTFSGLGKMIIVDPGAEQKLNVTFHPKGPGDHENEIKMSILQNPFEATTFKLAGNGYLEDVALEIPNEANVAAEGDELIFGDIPVGNTISKSVTLVNYSDSPYKFEWQSFSATSVPEAGAAKGKAAKKKAPAEPAEDAAHPDFTFSPSIGHVQPNSSKTITVTFNSGIPRKHEKVANKCSLSKIRYLTAEERKAAKAVPATKAKGKAAKGKGKGKDEDEAPVVEEYDLANMDWDDTQKISTWVPKEPAEAKDDAKVSGRKKGKDKKAAEPVEAAEAPELVEVMEISPEPEHEMCSGDAEKENSQVTRELSTRLSVTCDKAVYDLKVNSVNFRPTMMFQTREFKFPFNNTSTINLKYNWKMTNLQHNSRAENVEVSNPFKICKTSGTISSGLEEFFTVSFSPMDALSYKIELVAEIENLPADCERPRILLRGQGQRPKCHFELVNSDYLSANRRQVGLPGPGDSTGPLDPAYRCIEFKSLGVKVRNTRRFYVMNPTNVSYAFEWRCEDGSSSKSANPYRCTTMSGIVESGRKYEMVFQFIPEEDALVESFWRFEIVDHDINIPILLVGSVAEPEVKLESSNLKFEPLMLGRRQTETIQLINKEHIPFSFQIDKSSIQSGGIDIKPLQGVVGPETSLPINLTFLPKREMMYNWNVLFNIRNKPGRVALNVKGEGYAINSNVGLKEEKESNIQRDLYRDETNRVDFGAVHIYEKRVKTVVIANEGKFTFNYTWKLPQNRFVTISPMSGSVRAGSKGEVDISYYTATEAAVDNLVAVCTIANSNANKYAIAISGRGKKPSLEFSALQHDFGKAFVGDHNAHEELTPTVKMLRIVNHEHDQNVAIDMLFESTPHLQLPATSCVMAPGETIEVPVTFTPQDNRKYREMVPFEINGLYKVNVLVTGEGTPLKLDLADPSQQSISFGQVRVGAQSTRSATLINHSKKTVTFSLSRPSGCNDLLSKFLVMYPNFGQEVSLRPKDSLRMEMVFEPNQRMPPFSTEVMVNAHGTTRRLMLVSGTCHGVGMRLESEKLPFGNVIEHSSLTKKVKLSNTGDVGTSYKWEQIYKPHFSIEPSEGFLPAGGGVTMEVTFHPAFLSNDIRFEKVPCLVDGQPANDMYLTLSGGCVSQPKDNIEELRFSTKVRQTETQTIKLINPTEKRWTIRPSIQNEFWSGEQTVEVPANGVTEYTISFTPQSMTKEEGEEVEDGKKSGKGKGKDKRPASKKDAKRPKTSKSVASDVGVKDLGNNENRPPFHEGSLFFPLPNGKALNYRLVGHASFPDPEGTIEVSVPAKKPFVQPLIVKNWLNSYQRFKVIIEAEEKDPGVTLTGSDTVDVPGLTDRKHKLQFYAFKEGETRATVTFLNESSGESISYSLVFTATGGESSSTIPPLVTPIRQQLAHDIVIKNPLDTEAVFESFKCGNSSVFVQTPVTIPPKSSGVLPLLFRPLIAFEKKEVELMLPCATLGEFKYTLNLTCTPHVAERSLRFNTNLGNEVKQTYRFTSFATNPTDYECKLDGNQFELDTVKVSAPAAAPGSDGVEVSVDIRYEPSAVGNTRGSFTASSSTGGDYTCILFGNCELPKPQGPIIIGLGQTGSVKFKNVLETAETFNFSVDNPAFILAKKTEKLNPKGVLSLSVQYKPEGEAGGGKGKDKKGADVAATPPAPVAMGKLLVSCPATPKLSWVYYLRSAPN